jgi:septal ring factor EnvC (AmiA/AmiB activator)
MICPGGFLLLGPRSALVAGLGLALPVALASTGLAQERPSIVAQNDKASDAIKQRDQELQAARDAQRQSADNEAAIKREIEEIGADRRKLNEALINTASRLRDAEAQVTATEARLRPLDDNEARIRKSLEGRRGVIAEVLAALQRIGRHPPPALMTSPEDALHSVRTAMLMGAVLPEMRHEVEALASDLTGLVAVRKQITAEHDRLNAEVASLSADRTRMAALIGERQKQQADREKALDAERKHANDLARQVDNLKDLIAKMEHSLEPVTRADREAGQGDSKPALAALNDPGRMAPAAAFASLRGRVPIPVNGVKLKEFGAPDSTGGVEKGVSVATRAGAQVTAPADGWVVYAGPFRSYGQLLILNVGGGYHVLLAGMDRISVDLGQFVLAGEPVAVMGNGSHIAAVLATGSSQPVLYIEFRKDGTPVDPGPWWAAGEGEKVRG